MDDHHYEHVKLKPGPTVKVRYERAGKLPPRAIWSEQDDKTPNFEALRAPLGRRGPDVPRGLDRDLLALWRYGDNYWLDKLHSED